MDFPIWIWVIASVAVISLTSLVGIFFVFLTDRDKSPAIMELLVGLAIGALLGGTFFHLVPKVFEHVSHTEGIHAAWLILGGILFFFLFEKYLHHSHHRKNSGIEVFGPINIVADLFHNIVDGILVAVAYYTDIDMGIAVTLAVLLHEFPQELGDFGILIKAGYTKTKALLYNFLSALGAVFGAVLIIILPVKNDHLTHYLLPISIAGFLYLAMTNLLPVMHTESTKSKTIKQMVGVLLGVLMVYLIHFINHEH